MFEEKKFNGSERENVDSNFFTIYHEAERLVEKIGTPPKKPRLFQCQTYRSNIPSENIFEHYKQNIVIPFLDHVIFNLNQRFSKLSTIAASLIGLVPAIICDRDLNVDNIFNQYHSDNDLPSPDLMITEITR